MEETNCVSTFVNLENGFHYTLLLAFKRITVRMMDDVGSRLGVPSMARIFCVDYKFDSNVNVFNIYKTAKLFSIDYKINSDVNVFNIV
jgi:hypothetical protein